MIVLQGDRLVTMIQVGLALASSTRPQDGTTAAYLFRLLLRLPQTGDMVMSLRYAPEKVCNSICLTLCSSHLSYVIALENVLHVDLLSNLWLHVEMIVLYCV